MKLLSVCMIVKNEEDTLERCLNSVKEIADEIIIMDTGSTDRTKEIAFQFTDLVFDFEWYHDFAGARNASIERATAKWVLVLDADEFLPEAQLVKWKKLLKEQKAKKDTAYTLTIANHYTDDKLKKVVVTAPVSRLFPNNQGIKFSRPIHEQLVNKSGTLKHQKIDLDIIHTGYEREVIEKKNKNERNIRIFQNIKDNGIFTPYDYFTLGNQFASSNEIMKAIDNYEIALKNINEQTSWYSSCVLNLIRMYTKENKLELSWKLIMDKLSKYQDYPEYHTSVGIHYELFGSFNKAVESYKMAIVCSENKAAIGEEAWLCSPEYGTSIPINQLIQLSFRLNRSEDAVYWMSKMLQNDNFNIEVLSTFIEFLIQHENVNSIIPLLNNMYNLSNPREIYFLYTVILNSCNKGLVDYYKGYFAAFEQRVEKETPQLALINSDLEAMEKNLQVPVDKLAHNSWIYVAAGAFLWKRKEWLNVLDNVSSESDKKGLSQLLQNIIDEQKEIDIYNFWTKELFLIAQALFKTQQYEAYDSFVQIIKHPELINMLANYFYKVGLYETAFNYYSTLHVADELNSLSLENLGLYSLNHENGEDGVGFLSIVLDQNPKILCLYYPLIKHADVEIKQKYIQQFQEQFKSLSSISFFKESFFQSERRV